jgi:SAM-dependent methyltransferase
MRAGTMLSARTVGAVPGEWDGTAAAYARSFALLCAGAVGPLLDGLETRLPARGSLLDVGTGTGSVAIAATARGWAASASDPEPDMRAITAAAGVAVRPGALPRLPDPDGAADAVTAAFVVNHAHRPRAALAELARVARHEVAVAVWPRRRTVLNGLWSGIVADAGAAPVPGTAVDPEHDIDRSEDGLAAALVEAGLVDVRTELVEWDFEIDPAELWAGVEGGAGTIGTTYRAQDAVHRDAMRDAYRARTAELRSDDGLLHLPSFGLLGFGSRGPRGER